MILRIFAFIAVTGVLLLDACGSHQGAGVSLDRPIRRMISPDTKALGAIDLAALKETAFYKRESTRLDGLMNAAPERIGLDPRRDLSQLVAAWDGKKVLIIAKGRFSPNELERKLAAAGAHETPYRKYKLLGDVNNSVVFLNSDLALAGALEVVEPAIDAYEDGRGEIPQTLEDRMDKVPKGDQLWLVSAGGLPFVEMRMRSDLESALSNIVDYVNGSLAGVRVDSGLHLQAEISCVSDEGAKRVHDALRGLIGFGRLSTKDDEQDLLRAYDGIHVDQNHSVVDIKADLSGDLADALLNRLSGAAPRRAAMLR